MSATAWVKALKIAVIEEDTETLAKLQFERPVFTNLKTANEAKALVDQAIHLLTEKRRRVAEEMAMLKKGIRYQENAISPKTVFSSAV